MVDETKLNLIEIVLRAYDPWYSCAAHMIVEDAEGNVVFEIVNEE
jgi:coenzyme F420-reducing hydrogenase alpha subunit